MNEGVDVGGEGEMSVECDPQNARLAFKGQRRVSEWDMGMSVGLVSV